MLLSQNIPPFGNTCVLDLFSLECIFMQDVMLLCIDDFNYNCKPFYSYIGAILYWIDWVCFFGMIRQRTDIYGTRIYCRIWLTKRYSNYLIVSFIECWAGNHSNGLFCSCFISLVEWLLYCIGIVQLEPYILPVIQGNILLTFYIVSPAWWIGFWEVVLFGK